MSVDEVNQNTLNTAEVAGYMVAPYAMTGLQSTYYGLTGRPKEAGITAALGFGLPLSVEAFNTFGKPLVVASMLGRQVRNTKLPDVEMSFNLIPKTSNINLLKNSFFSKLLTKNDIEKSVKSYLSTTQRVSDNLENNFKLRMIVAKKYKRNNREYVEPIPGTYENNNNIVENELALIMKDEHMTYDEAVKEFTKRYGNTPKDVKLANGYVWDDDNGNIKAAVYDPTIYSRTERTLAKLHEWNHTGMDFHNHPDNTMIKYKDVYTGTDKYYVKKEFGFAEPDFTNPLTDVETTGYLDSDEVSSYASTLLSILGKTKLNLTGKELKWLSDHLNLFIPTIGNRKEYKQLFKMITDYDKAANWINKHSTILAAPLGVYAGTKLINK